MSREIKFRAWDEQSQTFEHFDLLMTKDVARFGKGNWTLENLQQFTGLKDKNGVEIYEGDIVHVLEEGDYGGEFNAEIEYLDNWATYGVVCLKVKEIEKSKTNNMVETIFTRGFLTRHFGSCIQLGEIATKSEFKTFEVIGNIFENPDLLEKGTHDQS